MEPTMPQQKFFRPLMLTLLTIGVAAPVLAGELTVQIADGRATVIARDVPIRQILEEWARVGNTKVVNAEKMVGGPLTLELVDMPEKDALDILLRSAAGYMAAPRPEQTPGASLYDRVIILASSRPPPPSAAPPPQPFGGNRPFVQQALPQQPPPDVDDQQDDQTPMPPPGMMPPRAMPPGAMPPGAMPPAGTMPPPGMMPPGATYPGAPGTDPNQQPAPITSPRPGMLPPPPQPSPGNPYQVRPGAGQTNPDGTPVQPRPTPEDR